MNLHEECLLKYLLNPMDLFHSTELLRLNNEMIESGFISNKLLRKTQKSNYNAIRV